MKISSLQLLTNDIDATTGFYQDKVGLEYAGGDELTAIFKAGHTLLTFIHSEVVEKPIYHFAFTLPCNKLPEAFSQMQDKVNILEVPPSGKIADFSNWNANAFYFYDNNGNIVEYIVRHSLYNESTLPFSGNSIESISETGLVSTDVPALAEQIRSNYHIPFFDKQPPQEHFTVMGDDQGLLILAKVRRPWFPTETPSGIFPVRLSITDEMGNEQMLQFGYQ